MIQHSRRVPGSIVGQALTLVALAMLAPVALVQAATLSEVATLIVAPLISVASAAAVIARSHRHSPEQADDLIDVLMGLTVFGHGLAYALAVGLLSPLGPMVLDTAIATLTATIVSLSGLSALCLAAGTMVSGLRRLRIA